MKLIPGGIVNIMEIIRKRIITISTAIMKVDIGAIMIMAKGDIMRMPTSLTMKMAIGDTVTLAIELSMKATMPKRMSIIRLQNQGTMSHRSSTTLMILLTRDLHLFRLTLWKIHPMRHLLPYIRWRGC